MIEHSLWGSEGCDSATGGLVERLEAMARGAPSSPRMQQALSRWEAMAAQGRKRAALFSRKRSAQLYLDEILRLPAWPCLSYLPQISHAREAHMARLTANDDIHGHGDEYRSSSAVLHLGSRIAWPTGPIRLLLGCASKDRSRNSDMAVPCRTKLHSTHDSTNRFARWFNCGQYSTISGTRPGFVQLSCSLQ
jgi:hypothetical protein